jgi:hypothetical protein
MRVVRYAFLAEIDKPFLFLHSLGRLRSFAQPFVLSALVNCQNQTDSGLSENRSEDSSRPFSVNRIKLQP